ncbi:MAG: hypothetical protein FWH57_05610 [Oscillospiraceae bacterium]|nr:hypothetical protein [Oscillospiraceae bacterium]
MRIEQAIDTIYNGLVSENSVPVKLRTYKKLDIEQLDQVRKALDFALEYYKNKSSIPKKIAISMVDIYGAFSFKKGYFDDKTLMELEDIGIELQKIALRLFSG